MDRLKQTVFGRDPALVRHRLRNISIFLWSAIFLFNVVCRVLFGCHVLSMLGYYFAALVCYYIWHWFAHQPWTLKDMYRVHMYHHHVQFPLKKFLWRTYDIANPARTLKTSLSHDGPLVLALAIVMVLSRVVFHAQNATIACGVGLYCFLGFLGIYLHDAAHIDGHWLERYLWFHDLRALHYRHHMGSTKTNYGFLDFAADAVMDTAAEGAYILSNDRVGILNHTPHSVAELKQLVEWKTGAKVKRLKDGKGEILEPAHEREALEHGTTLEFEMEHLSNDASATEAEAAEQRDKRVAAAVEAEVATKSAAAPAAGPPGLSRAKTIKLTVQHRDKLAAANPASPKAGGGAGGPPGLMRQASTAKRAAAGDTTPAPAPAAGEPVDVEHDLDDHAIHYDKLGAVLSVLLGAVGLY